MPHVSSPTIDRSASARALSRGQWLLVISAFAFSAAGFFTREAPVNLWAMTFWRNVFGSAALLPFILAARGDGGWRAVARIRGWGWGAVAASSLATIAYLAAFARTSVANVSIIYASAPLVAAFIAWAWLGERPSPRTLAAAVLALCGVAITVSGSIGGGGIVGDGLALAMTILFALVTVFARRAGDLPPLPMACVASLTAAAAALPLGAAAGASFVIPWTTMAWLAAFGICAMAIALPCYFAGAARVPAGQAMLISAAELPLAPLWVWLAFGERPSIASFIGGGIVAMAVLWQLSAPLGPRPSRSPIPDVPSATPEERARRPRSQRGPTPASRSGSRSTRGPTAP
jgi:drug/metabolite transporter (DMT)-like permease